MASLTASGRHRDVRVFLLPTACACTLIAIVATGILLNIIPSITFLTLFLASATALFILFRAGRLYDVLHPVRVFGSVWTFCLALSTLRLITFTSVWGLKMWACVLVALVAFVGGYWLMAHYLHLRWPHAGPHDAQELPKGEHLAPKRTLILALLCLVIGMLAIGYQDWQIGTVPILAPDIEDARTTIVATASNWSHPEFDTLPNKFAILFGIYCKYAALLATFVLVQRTPKTKTQLIAGVSIILLALVTLGSMGGRAFLIEYTVPAVALFHYLRRRIRLGEMGIAGLSLLVLLAAAGYTRSMLNNPGYTHDVAKQISNLPVGPVWDSAAFGVQTLTSSLEVFNRLMQDAPALREHSSGFLFYSFHRFLKRDNIQELTSRLYTMATITPTFLGEFYLDYGGVGILVGPLVLGAIFGYVYLRAMRYNSAYWLMLQTIFLALLAYLPYVNLFSQNTNWIWDTINMAWLIYLARAARKGTVSVKASRRIGIPSPANLDRASYHT